VPAAINPEVAHPVRLLGLRDPDGRRGIQRGWPPAWPPGRFFFPYLYMPESRAKGATLDKKFRPVRL